MSTKVISKKFYHCVCELCKAEWDTKEFRLPPRCTSCGSYRWNGVDRRRKDEADTEPSKQSKKA
jgi:PHP family Zn ribbon phosphoesterase